MLKLQVMVGLKLWEMFCHVDVSLFDFSKCVAKAVQSEALRVLTQVLVFQLGVKP